MLKRGHVLVIFISSRLESWGPNRSLHWQCRGFKRDWAPLLPPFLWWLSGCELATKNSFTVPSLRPFVCELWLCEWLECCLQCIWYCLSTWVRAELWLRAVHPYSKHSIISGVSKSRFTGVVVNCKGKITKKTPYRIVWRVDLNENFKLVVSKWGKLTVDPPKFCVNTRLGQFVGGVLKKAMERKESV